MQILKCGGKSQNQSNELSIAEHKALINFFKILFEWSQKDKQLKNIEKFTKGTM